MSTTTRELLKRYASGAITFDDLLADIAARDWPGKLPARTWAEAYDRAETMPGDDDPYWIDSAADRRVPTVGERERIVQVIETAARAV